MRVFANSLFRWNAEAQTEYNRTRGASTNFRNRVWDIACTRADAERRDYVTKDDVTYARTEARKEVQS